MKYFEVGFTIQAPEALMQDARDLTAALAGEAGFETFEENEAGLLGYVQQTLFSESALREALNDFPIDGVTIAYSIREAEDKDWNEQWEQEGFDPIVVAGSLVIHDGRHLPEAPYPIQIEIDARLAFGTGTHETTRLVCTYLLDTNLQGCRILDCGTGTGILSIAALKLGAASALGYDIDEWSVDNARHNAIINHVDDRFESLLGNAGILNGVDRKFDIVMANINRNILLADLPQFHQMMTPDGKLLLSGFYEEDIPLLESRAAAFGLKVIQTKTDHRWACILLQHEFDVR